MIKRADTADQLCDPDFSASILTKKNHQNRYKAILDNLSVGVMQISEDERILSPIPVLKKCWDINRAAFRKPSRT